MKFGTCEQNWDLFGTSLTALFRCSIMSGQRSTFSVSPLPPSLPICDRKKFFLEPKGQLETKRYLDTRTNPLRSIDGLPKVSRQKTVFTNRLTIKVAPPPFGQPFMIFFCCVQKQPFLVGQNFTFAYSQSRGS